MPGRTEIGRKVSPDCAFSPKREQESAKATEHGLTPVAVKEQMFRNPNSRISATWLVADIQPQAFRVGVGLGAFSFQCRAGCATFRVRSLKERSFHTSNGLRGPAANEDLMNATVPQSGASAESWTVQRILEWTAGFLKQKGIESPRLEAELLLAHARKCPRIRLYTDFTEIVSESDRAIMRELVQRRARREPLAYIVGTKEFYGRAFDVGQGVLIPRPETEILVDVCLERIPRDESRQIIEVGFGSGCISITIARQRPQCEILATDISSQAMEIASRNVARYDVGSRVTLVAGDVLEPVLQTGRKYDGLVSNPPYIRDDERSTLEPEVAVHEPPEALYAGQDGLNIVRRIVQQAPAVLKPGAFLALELDPAQCSTAVSLLTSAGFETVSVRRDLSGNERIVEATFKGD